MPLDDYSEKLMRQQYFDKDSKFEKLLLDDNGKLFDKLWDSGIIEKINTETGSLIDDYETEFIEMTQLDSIITIIHNLRLSKLDSDFQDFILQFKSLVEMAKDSRKPLCFIF